MISTSNMLRVKLLISLLLVSLLFFSSTTPLFAAQFKAGDSIFVAENQTGLQDLYLFGSTITQDAPITNDLVVAGGTVTLNGDVTGSLIAAGGDVTIRSSVHNTMRVAGGTVIISGKIDRDVLVAGGDVRVTKDASISGDLIIAGGQLRVEGPVQGKIIANGGEVNINSTVGGNVEGTMETLTLGSNARIGGDLSYHAPEEAKIASGAYIEGRRDFQQVEKRKDTKRGINAVISAGSVYKLATDIIASFLFVLFLPLLIKRVLEQIKASPAASAGLGFLVLFFMPLACLFLLVLLPWLGIAGFLFYGIVLIVSIFLAKVATGWWIMHWWEKRNNRKYILNWKAAIVGPLVFFILFLIPIAGWLAAFIIYLVALGALTKQTYNFAIVHRHAKHTS
jgi:cytoskeletal protein CcmA (bactofilin family)